MNNKNNYSIWRSKNYDFVLSSFLFFFSLNIKQKFEFLEHLLDGEKLLSVVLGVVSFSFDKPLHFHDTTFFRTA